jgi:hypothetical protein
METILETRECMCRVREWAVLFDGEDEKISYNIPRLKIKELDKISHFS